MGGVSSGGTHARNGEVSRGVGEIRSMTTFGEIQKMVLFYEEM